MVSIFKDDYDLLATRGFARSVAAMLKARGWDARVEESGPAHQREYRVLVTPGAPAEHATFAYFEKGDDIDNYRPRWR